MLRGDGKREGATMTGGFPASGPAGKNVQTGRLMRVECGRWVCRTVRKPVLGGAAKRGVEPERPEVETSRVG